MKDNINIQTNNLMRVFFCFFVVVVVYRPFELRGYCHGGLFCVFSGRGVFACEFLLLYPSTMKGHYGAHNVFLSFATSPTVY